MQSDLEGVEGGPASLRSAEPDAWPVQAGWADLLAAFWASAQGQTLAAYLRTRLAAGAVIYPPQPMRALELTPPEAVRVVVLGQDPYHGPGQAEGLAFSVAPGVRPPPSLRNIFAEIQRDLGTPPPVHGSLVRWAQQGVLLINASLTVESEQPASHAMKGWEALTDKLIRRCVESGPPKVFLLWGAHAQKKASLIDPARHRVLSANHPSPLSARRGPVPFIGCGHFRQANEWLESRGLAPVRW
ncbi:MAG: uracil-DNA glycosylase [Hydrogenophaga sp.]|uniref:uracil-DNA glycosylase n=1 Tax=Hydrogenophaga sp. TaxID=1904254 RepID=UPI003D150F3C